MSGFTQNSNHAFVYVFIRQDLTPAQIAVQSCHACIESANAFDLGKLSDHPSVIILGVRDETKLHQARQFLMDNGIKHCHFYERDLDDQLTSLATGPIFGEQRKLFRKFQLLRLKGGA